MALRHRCVCFIWTRKCSMTVTLDKHWWGCVKCGYGTCPTEERSHGAIHNHVGVLQGCTFWSTAAGTTGCTHCRLLARVRMWTKRTIFCSAQQHKYSKTQELNSMQYRGKKLQRAYMNPRSLKNIPCINCKKNISWHLNTWGLKSLSLWSISPVNDLVKKSVCLMSSKPLKI